MLTLKAIPSKLNTILFRSLFVSIVMTMAVLLEIVPPTTDKSLRVSFGSPVYAQPFTDDEIRRYAEAGRKIEVRRRQTYRQIQKITGNSPTIFCYRPNSYRNLPERAINIAQEFCNESETIVKDSGLTIKRFNQINSQRRENQNLNQRILQYIR